MNSKLVVVVGLVLVLGVKEAWAGAPIPTQVKQCVGFVFGPSIPGEVRRVGTGFFVAVRTSDPSRFYGYFVTAKHVLQPKSRVGFFNEVSLRLNTRDGKTTEVVVPIVTEGPSRTVFFPDDASVDLAAIPVQADQSVLEYLPLPDDVIATKEIVNELGIAEGSDVFFTGLFTPYLGAVKNYPIVRFGRVALMTPEKIPWVEAGQERKMMDLYLMETNSFGGNSGSPVFFYLGSDRVPGSLVVGPPKLYLAGVVMGYFFEAHEVKGAAALKSVENGGIAAVVPAYKLHELLFGPQLSALRK